MKSDSILQLAFENVASHISNLDTMQELINELSEQNTSIEDIIRKLEDKLESSEVTFRTDTRILLNEIRHLLAKESI